MSELDFAAILAEAARLKVATDEPIMLSGAAGRVEYFGHELGHALSLGIPLRPGIARRIEERLLRAGTDAAIENEALVLAAEAIVLSRLGFIGGDLFADDQDLRGSLIDAAHVQGVTTEAMLRYFDCPAAAALAERMLGILRSLR